MTTTPTIDDYEHPSWCDLARCIPEASGGGLHASVGTMLPLANVHLTTSMFLDDGRHPLTGKLSTDARLTVAMEDMESLGRFCAAYLQPDDARLLAQVLVRYADLCESAQRDSYRFSAEALRSDGSAA